MIYGKISELESYVGESVYSELRAFLEKISPDMEEGKYEIRGREIYARVMSYATDIPENCNIEAHDKYIDIQGTISGAEGIDLFDRSLLTAKTDYDESKDVVLFEGEKAVAQAHTENVPGRFTLLLPQEAHRPKENVPGYGRVKKFVIKVAVSVLGE